MGRRIALFLSLALGAVTAPTVASAQSAPGSATYTPGAPSVGDPYYPADGNGGYDVDDYDLELRYDPATDVLTGTAEITARATQNLSAFNLDLVGLTVRSVTVGGRPATWSRSGQELTITPSRGIANRSRFEVVIRYDGIPQPVIEGLGVSGFVATDDGNIVAGQPHGAAYWFPANDHPIDRASIEMEVTVPAGLEVVANGRLKGQTTRRGWTTWEWEAKEPMAPYLATMNIGQFDIRSYRSGRIQFWDAIDPDLLKPVASPTTGTAFLLSGPPADSSYKRLVRTISVPAGGATVGFTVTRDTEADWDFFFVEAHTVGQDDWTTLEDVNGHTSDNAGFSCSGWQAIHPFIGHYQTVSADGTCSPEGSSGPWWAATGRSDGPETWQVALPPGPARDVEISLSYASDDVVQGPGVFIDDIVVSTGPGTTSFEADGVPLDGWTLPGPPPGSPGNATDWIVGTTADLPPPVGEVARNSFKRQPEILDFLARTFGPYPFTTAGGIVDDVPLGFALETQTRPIYSSGFFGDPVSADSVVVHENAHQWYGDNLALERWQHIWLNEGFATYAEWLWSDREGLGTAQETFDFLYNVVFPEGDPFWTIPIGDPGPENQFDFAVYARGAMTLHTLRLTVGEDAFFRILRQWAKEQAGGTVTTAEFIALAERVSGQQLDALFDTWLNTTTRPPAPAAATTARSVGTRYRATVAARSLLHRLGIEG